MVIEYQIYLLLIQGDWEQIFKLCPKSSFWIKMKGICLFITGRIREGQTMESTYRQTWLPSRYSFSYAIVYLLYPPYDR